MADNNDTNDTIGQLPGGVIRFTPASSVPDLLPVQEGIGQGVRDQGALTVDSDGNMREHGRFMRETTRFESDPSLGVMASARSLNGNRSAPVTLQSVVDLPNGIGTTTVANAINLGFVRQVAPGQFQDTGKDAAKFVEQVNASQQAPAQQQPQEIGLLRETEEVISRVESSIPPGMAAAFEHELLVRGPAAAVDRFSEHSTMSAADLMAAAEHITASYRASLAHHLAKAGVDHQAFSDWVRVNALEESKRAAIQHAATRRASSWDSLIAAYRRKAG